MKFEFDGYEGDKGGSKAPDDGIPLSNRQMIRAVGQLQLATLERLECLSKKVEGLEERLPPSKPPPIPNSIPQRSTARKSNDGIIFLVLLGVVGVLFVVWCLIPAPSKKKSDALGALEPPRMVTGGIVLGSLRETSTGLDWNKATYEDKKALCQFLKENRPENCHWEDYLRILQDYYRDGHESKVNKTIQAALEANAAVIRSAASASEEKYRFSPYYPRPRQY
jgi:hypothetical protein